MPDQVPDGSQGQGEGAALATPTFSDVPVVAASEKTFDEEALVAKIVDRLAPEIDKRFQSAKDKRFSTLDKLGGGDELLKLKDYIKQQGGDVDKAVREMQLDNLLNQRAQGSPAPEANRAAVDTTSVQTRTAELLTDAGIAFDDAEYLALTKKPYRAPDEFYQSVSKLAIRRAKQQHTPGAATLAVEGGAAPASGSTTKTDKLLARQSELSRKPHLSAAEKAELIQVKSSLRAEIGA